MIKSSFSLLTSLIISIGGVGMSTNVYAQSMSAVDQGRLADLSKDKGSNSGLSVNSNENKRFLDIISNLFKTKDQNDKIKVQIKKIILAKKTVKVAFNNKIAMDKFKNFIRKHNPGMQKSLANKITVSIFKYSKAVNIDPKLILALIAKESSFNTHAVSPVGAMGLGQLMRGTASGLGVSNPFNPIENIKGTTKYVSQLSKKFKGNIDLTLASYNMGPGAVERSVRKGRSLPYQVAKYVSQVKSFKTMI